MLEYLITDYYLRLLAALHHYATPTHQVRALADPLPFPSALYNYSLALANSTDDPFFRNFRSWGFPADTFAVKFAREHLWFSFFIQAMLLLGAWCFVVLGCILAYERIRGEDMMQKDRDNYTKLMTKIKEKTEEALNDKKLKRK